MDLSDGQPATAGGADHHGEHLRKKGKEIKRVANDLKVQAPDDAPATGRLERSVNLPLKFDHDAKAVRPRVVVRVAASGRIGTADVVLTP